MKDEPFNPLIADIYVNHLASVIQPHPAIAQEDIYNQFGILLLAKGSPISNNTVAKLSNHKLAKPIDDVIRIGRSLTNQTLLTEFEVMFKRNHDLKNIHEKNKATDLLVHLCVVQHFHTTLLQKLTVLKQEYPSSFERTLFDAWFSSLVARELGWSKEDIHHVFVASLFQDLGLLHIPADIVLMNGGFTPKQWRVMQSHVVISKIIVESLGIYPDSVINGIMEHHERGDGAGYPLAKNVNSLSDIGQLVGLSDLLFRIRGRTTKSRQQRSLSSAFTYLQVNNRPAVMALHEAAMSILKRSELAIHLHLSDSDYHSMINLLIKRSVTIHEIFYILRLFSHQLDEIKLGRLGYSISLLAEKALFVYKTSGFFHQHFFRELETFSFDELEDADKTQVEFLWIIKRIQQNTHQFIENELTERHSTFEPIISSLNQLSLLLNTLDLNTFSPQNR